MKMFLLGSFLLAAATSNLLVHVSAFPSGAGRCQVGMPSPTGPHGSLMQSLSSGGFEVSVDGADYNDLTGIVTAQAGQEFSVTIAGDIYKGVLIMVANEPDTAIVDMDYDLMFATGSGCGDTASATHRDASSKESSTVTVMVADPVETTLELNVVVSTGDYFYTQLDLDIV